MLFGRREVAVVAVGELDVEGRLERAFLLGNRHITPDLLISELDAAHDGFAVGGRFNLAVSHTERKLLQQALEEANGNKSAAARALGMRLSTFRDKLKKYDL